MASAAGIPALVSAGTSTASTTPIPPGSRGIAEPTALPAA